MKHTFWFGAVGYPILELLYRGRTHYSMALAGGISAALVERIRRLPFHPGMKALLGGCAITCVEYVCGRIWNRDFVVWDYRKLPFNLHGQVCLTYTLLWCGLSALVMKGSDIIDRQKGRT